MSARVLATLALVGALVLALFGAVADAQPAGRPAINAPITANADGAPIQAHVVHRAGVNADDAAQSAISTTSAHGDRVESHGKGMALLFWLFAAGSIGGALFVVTRRNLITAVMGMVGSFLGIAAIYMMLYAHFLSVVQMLVYAGAIMVLFVFVIMILNRPEDEPVAPSGRAGQVVGGIAILYLVGRLIMLLVHVHPANPALAFASPAATPEGYDWGTVKAVGTDLFGNGLFPFEAISILLLVAVVGAIAIARPLNEDAEEHDPNAARLVADPDAVAAAQSDHAGRHE